MKNLKVLSLTLLLSAYTITQTKGLFDTWFHKKAAGAAATDAKEHAKAACKDIGKCVQHSAHVVENVAADAKDEVVDRTVAAGKHVKRKAQELAHSTQETAQGVAVKVQKTAHIVADKTQEIAHEAKDKVVAVGEKFVESNHRATQRIIKEDALATEKMALKTADAAHNLAAKAEEVAAKAEFTARKAHKTHSRTNV